MPTFQLLGSDRIEAYLNVNVIMVIKAINGLGIALE